MIRTSKNWPRERIDRLIAMYKAGQGASIIALALGTTRNAVLGKANRIGLSRQEGRVLPPKTAAVQFGNYDPFPDRGCLWNTDGHWCGCRTRLGSAYCENHYNLSVQSPRPPLDVSFLASLQ